MVVKHLNPNGRREGGGKVGEEGGGASHLVKSIEQLKRGCFALLARHNKTTCGRHVYTPSSESRRELERRKKWDER